jgi:hypothetical protein
MVGWWPGDGSAADLIASNTGTLVGSATFATGQVGSGFKLSGGFVSIPDSPSLRPSPHLSIDFWVRFDNLEPALQFLVFKKNPNSADFEGYTVVKNRVGGVDHFRFAMVHESVVLVTGTTAVTTGRFYHVAATYDGTRANLYLDGVLESTVTATITPFYQIGKPLVLGSTAEGFDGRLQGVIDEVEIFNRALTADEVSAIHGAGSTGKCRLLVANAGKDQSVDEGTPVSLDGSGSSPALGGGPILEYQWEQVAGPSAALNTSDPQHPTFTAPTVDPGGATLSFKLTVTDGTSSAFDTVDVTVKNVNSPPVADAGIDQVVNEGSGVALSGSASFDPDNDTLTYQWIQTGGPTVALDGATTVAPTFTAPLLAGGTGGPETLTFHLAVSDSLSQTGTDDVTVTVEQVNHAPVADAGLPQTVHSGTPVALDGSGSADPDGDEIAFNWSQTGGPPVALANAGTATPSFVAPPVGGSQTLTFQLVVGDGYLNGSKQVEVTVTNGVPRCDLALPSLNFLWPPNHGLHQVAITNVTDPNAESVTITITGVSQDEPVNGLGDGDTSPDAVIQGAGVLLRAERAGAGNGRVYQVTFTADDGQGGTCTGTVRVGVPKSMKPGQGPVDDGQLYDSIQP